MYVYEQEVGPEPSMYEQKYYKDIQYIPLGSVLVFSHNTARTSNGLMVAGHPNPQESTIVLDQIATTGTPENSPVEVTTKLDKQSNFFLKVFAVWLLTGGLLGGICYGLYSLGVLAYCSASTTAYSDFCTGRG